MLVPPKFSGLWEAVPTEDVIEAFKEFHCQVETSKGGHVRVHQVEATDKRSKIKLSNFELEMTQNSRRSITRNV